jgi:hypothetical protein
LVSEASAYRGGKGDVSDAIPPESIGASLHSIRAEIARLADMVATRKELSEVQRVLIDRISNMETLVATWLDQQTTQIDARFDQLAALIKSAPH